MHVCIDGHTALQEDLATWGRVPELLRQITAALPPGAILTPPELQAIVRELVSSPLTQWLSGGK